MKRQGDTAELKFMLLFHQQGYIVSKPFGDNAKYDIIIDDNNGCPKRIQIKSTYSISFERTLGYYRVIIARGCKSKIAYESNSIDFFGIHVIPEDAYYLIPSSFIKGIYIKLYPHRPTKNKYEQFRIK